MQSVFLFLSLALAAASPSRILLDGELGDWPGREPVHVDPRGDGGGDGVDFGRLWITHDERDLYLRLELGVELSLQDDNAIELHLDVDVDARTGEPVQGIGADVVWRFGRRNGERWTSRGAVPLEHGDIGLISCPTVTSDEFEIAVARDALPGDAVRLVWTAGNGGDVLPDGAGGVSYSFDDVDLPPLAVVPLAKHDPAHLRVLSYNTNDHLFEPRRAAAYRRILRAVAPDLVLLQEVRSNTSRESAELLTPLLGAPLSGRWHHARIGGEASVLLSPFPIVEAFDLGDSGAFLLDARPFYDTRLLLVALSTPCCRREQERQAELDLILSFVRDARTPGGRVDVAEGTPLLLVGDANLVGAASQRRTLVEGAIADPERFGPAFAPDWDDTPFADLTPRHTHRDVTFTWYGASFTPGRLDYVVYSDSVVAVGNRYVLFTPEMPEAALAAYGLERDDVLVASDHLPVVADFILPRPAKLAK